MASRSLDRFNALLGYVDQLIDIHGRLQKGKGRRYYQEALHRSGVVLVVAAWEAYVEDVLDEALDLIERSMSSSTSQPVPAWAVTNFMLTKNRISSEIKQFHNPNAENIVRLFQGSIRFDPSDHWLWKAPRRYWGKADSMKEINEWLRIRHCIAHGAELPAEIPWLRGPSGQPRLVLGLLKDCKRTFEHFAEETDKGLGSFLKTSYGIPQTW